MKIAAFGFCCVDVYENLHKQYATGNGIDCIVNLAKKGVQGSAVTVVGDDAYGKEVFELCEKYGIDTSHIQVRHGSTSVFKMALKNGVDRVHLQNIPGVMEHYVPTREDLEFVKTHDYVHTDMYGKVLPFLPELKAAGCRIVLDFSLNKDFDKIGPVLRSTDYGFFSFEERAEEIKDFLKQAHSYGPAVVAATFGKQGSMCYDGERFYEQGILPAPVVNTVGAGDSFIAGFMYGVMNGWDIPACQDSGTRTAAEIVQLFTPY
ncbi:MAG: fructoselysine 6-kinase [Clostridiales bacterium]|nr:fructoselysine 6-kinase [Clostridiales bacterium]